ncbi:unnamed protein product [Calicophoron daubneyi]|uniref:RNA polymerase II subunit B1 CTD phosphatase RPAP2 homolog n=1 Tax=Calicophoron daubneyi TaxID=300641 RepID=A0AAV2U005_CALDB
MAAELLHKSDAQSRKSQLTDDEEEPIGPPPFQGPLDDKVATHKRQALFLHQCLCIAERFSYNPVTPAMLAAALPWLEREQYDAIAVERNALGNCGYILCPRPRGAEMSGQKYRISSGTRRVYDLTERRPFCSDWCYRAYNHVRKQISTEPGWCRSDKTCPKLSLLSKNATGRPGKLVLDALRRFRLSDDDGNDSSETESDSEVDRSPTQHISSDRSDDEYFSPSEFRKTLDSDDELYRDASSKATKPFKHRETSWGVEVKVPTHNLVIERPPQAIASDVSIRRELATTTTQESGLSLFCLVADRLFRWAPPSVLRLLVEGGPVAVQSQFDVFCDPEASRAEEPKETDDSVVMPPGVLPLVDSVSADTLRRHLLMQDLLPSPMSCADHTPSLLSFRFQHQIDPIEIEYPFWDNT